MSATRAGADPRTAWKALLSTRRLGDRSEPAPPRRAFPGDWDRILYSPHFRRLAGKTQVFPLPLDDHIHSRLTHTLEVATVGRSLGTLAGERIHKELPDGVEPRDLGDCVAAACLAHDVGNPPFGHVGEDAIREFFQRLGAAEGEPSAAWFGALGDAERGDLLALEGNAIALRLVTRGGGLAPHGLDLTCATLGALTKYPCGSLDAQGKRAERKSRAKHGVDTSELGVYAEIATALDLAPQPGASHAWFRHPLAFLTEAADDIAYQIIDLEDGLRLGHVGRAEFVELLRPLCERDPRCPPLEPRRDRDTMLELAGRLRSIAIETLVGETAQAFDREHEAILAGAFDRALVSTIASREAIARIEEKNVAACYSARDVLKLELAGSVAIQAVLDALIAAVIAGESVRSRHLRRLLPAVYTAQGAYAQTQRVVDFVAGMTDHYVVRLYRELSGIRLPGGRD